MNVHANHLQFGGLDVPALGLIEIDDGPDGVEVLHAVIQCQIMEARTDVEKKTDISLYIEILEVERMLPDIDADDRGMSQERILVGSGGDLQALGSGVQSLP